MTNSEVAVRRTLFPIQYPEIWQFYKKAVADIWTVDEISLARDLIDWDSISTDEKDFISKILAFFAGSDLIVIDNLIKRFQCEIDIMEVQFYYGSQLFIEQIHSELYAILIDAFIKNPVEKDFLFRAIETIPSIGRKAQWALKWIESKDATLGQRLTAFSIVEGLFFASSFCSIFWFKSRNLFPGMGFSNSLIAADESSHCLFACYLLNNIIDKPSEETIKEILLEAVKIEQDFIKDILPKRLLGINADTMCIYVEFVADRLLTDLKCSKMYNVVNPFNFMESISIDSKSNFFERDVAEYSKITTDHSLGFKIDEEI